MSWFFTSGGQSIAVSTSVLPMNIEDWMDIFRMDWLDIFAVQGTLKSLLQYHSSKASISSALSFLYSPTLTSMTTGKTIALTRGTFVGKVMSLLFNMLSRLVILKNRHYFAILIPACASSSPAFLMMCSAYKLNKQGDNIQP